MLFEGPSFTLEKLQQEILILTFDLKDQSTNVLGQTSLSDLDKVLQVLKNQTAKGLILRSGKSNGFVFGADVTEFLSHFKKNEEQLKEWIANINQLFNELEDLSYPTVALVNGFALGGGFEIALCMDYRLGSPKANLGLPETKLGIIPGWGGTIRLPRLIGADHAIEWITSGKHFKAEEALKVGALDGIVDESNLDQAGITFLERIIAGDFDWKKRRLQKKSPILLDKTESVMSFEGAKALVSGLSGPNYPAPLKAVESIQKGAMLERNEALKIENETFVFCAKTKTAECLTQVFLGDQFLKKISKKITKEQTNVTKAAVLGAGIMGGGISYQSAISGVPVLMKDIKDEQLQLGINEATKLLNKQIEKKKITTDKMLQVISQISPTLSYGDFKSTEFIVEAVVENEQIKKVVLSEVENLISENTILASNTSTISISQMASALKRPENFCGMHFFNPVHLMPLVEIIKGEKTSDSTVAKAVQYALQMGKTPIVVKDCAGFLVNRILFPYFNGFIFLIEDGIDFQRIDKIMEKFGWPMGPAYLLDVVGIDTAYHASSIMAKAFPDRMGFKNKTILETLFENKRYGQKNGLGFYEYEIDKKGKPLKKVNPEIYDLIQTAVKQKIEHSDEEIIFRMMLPMIIESSRCLEEQIVSSPTEIDMGLLLGLGFPAFRAGALKYADMIGLKNLEQQSVKFKHLGKLYEFTAQMNQMLKENKTYY